MSIFTLITATYLRKSNSGSHTHHCWQIDRYSGSEYTVHLADQTIVVPDGQSFLIPPFCQHRLIVSGPCMIDSIKFDPETDRFRDLPPSVIKEETSEKAIDLIFDPDEADLEIKEHYLFALLLQLLRCHAPPPTIDTIHDIRIAEALRLMKQRAKTNLSLDEIASSVSMSKNNFVRVFQREVGMSPMRKFRTLKANEAGDLLRHSDFSITQIADALGFRTIQAFSRFFHSELAIYPREYRNRHWSRKI